MKAGLGMAKWKRAASQDGTILATIRSRMRWGRRESSQDLSEGSKLAGTKSFGSGYRNARLEAIGEW